MARRLPLVLIILDGWGHSDEIDGNAIRSSDPRFIESLRRTYPHTLLRAAGEAVGLPAGYIGNSEVGHLCLGAGRVVRQDLARIGQSIARGEFESIAPLRRAVEQAARPGAALHLMGLLSDAGVHSHIDHLEAIVRMARARGVENLFVHAFLDGRDTPPRSALGYLRRLDSFLAREGVGAIATVSGRYYAMDRDARWDRIEKAYRLITAREGVRQPSVSAAIESAYADGIDDEFIPPAVIELSGAEAAAGATRGQGGPRRDGRVHDDDSVIFLNFRADRARQLTRAFTEDDARFDLFQRPGRAKLATFVCFTAYDRTWSLPVAFPPARLAKVLGEVLGAAGVSQLRIAETEKYAHVTYFFNGGEERTSPGEERCLISSPRIATYDLAPEMSARAVTAEVVRRIDARPDQVVILNYANADMVGHTGKLEPTVAACRTLDGCVETVVRTTLKHGGVALVTSDHGNAEQMIDPQSGGPHTAHTTNNVPLYLAGAGLEARTLRDDGLLADVAPTMLGLLGIQLPKEMEGRSLLLG
jgi:2,3-bisphosphoglycerate-independent phosphoglycerate mutase